MNRFDDVQVAERSFSFQELIGAPREWTPRARVRTVTTSGNVGPLDGLIRVNATGGAVTMTLESAIGCDGRQHLFKKIDASGNAMAVATADGGTLSTTTQYEVFRVMSNGTTWDRI